MSVIVQHPWERCVYITPPNIRIDNPHHHEDPVIFGEIQVCVARIAGILADNKIRLEAVHEVSTIQWPELVLRLRTVWEIWEHIRMQILTALGATEKESLKPAIIGWSHTDESNFSYIAPVPIPGTWTIRIPPRTTSHHS
jgi:hypothetical protein